MLHDMKAAASNKAGAMTGFMGMGMAMNAGGGMNAQNLFAMGQQQQQAQQQTPATPAAPAADGWKCACGATVSGNFCPNCGGKSLSHSLRQVLGNANAAPWLQENSVPSAALPSRRIPRAGPVPAAR